MYQVHDWHDWADALNLNVKYQGYTGRQWRSWVDAMSSCTATLMQFPERNVERAEPKSKVKKKPPVLQTLQQPHPTPAQGQTPAQGHLPSPRPAPTPAQGQTPAQGLPLQVCQTRSNSPSLDSSASTYTSFSSSETILYDRLGRRIPPARKQQEKPAQGSSAQVPIINSQGGPSASSGDPWKPPEPKYIVPMQGNNAKHRKKFRSQMRSAGGRFNRDMSNVRYVSNLIHAPPICNRVASGWKKPEIGCHCHLWTNFIQSNLDKTHLARTAFRCIDSDGMKGNVYAGRRVSFWRPGAQKTKRWYNGKVESLLNVQFPSGKRALVLGIN